HDRSQPVKGSPRDLHPIPGLKVDRNHADFAAPGRGLELGHDCLGDSRPPITKMHHIAHAPSVTNQSQARLQIEPREYVVQEERFSNPSRAKAGRTPIPDAGQKDFKAGSLAQLGGGNVFMLWLRLEAEPEFRRIAHHGPEIKLLSDLASPPPRTEMAAA